MPIDINDAYNPTTQACVSGAPGYSVVGYWYADDPTTINNCSPCRGRLIQVVKTDGTVVTVSGPGVTAPALVSTDLLDISEAVVNYLRAPGDEWRHRRHGDGEQCPDPPHYREAVADGQSVSVQRHPAAQGCISRDLPGSVK